MNPSGLCLCGCGLAAPIVWQSDTKRGWVNGQPVDYIHGHYMKKFIIPKARQRSVKTRSSDKNAIAVANRVEETMQARRRRTQKQGPYKAGATLKAKAAVGKIEAAMKRRG